jgi:hypothetical protein
MRSRLWLSAFVCALVAGCGVKELPVSGNVTWEGKPIEDGTITFLDADGKDASASKAAPIANGKYELKIKPGAKKVQINAFRESTKSDKKLDKKLFEAMGQVPKEQYIPKKYNTDTKLTANVAAGQTQFDFALTEK